MQAGIAKNLPLRTEILEIIDYPAAKINFEITEKAGRALPETDQRIFFDSWYNRVLQGLYTKKDLEKYCCQADLY